MQAPVRGSVLVTVQEREGKQRKAKEQKGQIVHIFESKKESPCRGGGGGRKKMQGKGRKAEGRGSRQTAAFGGLPGGVLVQSTDPAQSSMILGTAAEATQMYEGGCLRYYCSKAGAASAAGRRPLRVVVVKVTVSSSPILCCCCTVLLHFCTSCKYYPCSCCPSPPGLVTYSDRLA